MQLLDMILNIYSKDSRDIDIEKGLNFDNSKVRLGYYKIFMKMIHCIKKLWTISKKTI